METTSYCDLFYILLTSEHAHRFYQCVSRFLVLLVLFCCLGYGFVGLLVCFLVKRSHSALYFGLVPPQETCHCLISYSSQSPGNQICFYFSCIISRT